MNTTATSALEVEYISGKSRLYGIVGHPIEQVRSPEMFTASFKSRGADAILVPFHVLPDDFDRVVPALMAMPNLDGLIFTIPFKQRAMALAHHIGGHARLVGAVNALARQNDGEWKAEIFDGLGCVEAFRRRGLSFAGKRVMLIGAGGAGSAIAVAIAHEKPASLTLYDLDTQRASQLVDKVKQVDPFLHAEQAEPRCTEIDFLLNASPVGMLDDARLPLDITGLDPSVIVFDAIVKPEQTPLLAGAQKKGCVIVRGREMMLGQIARMTDYFGISAL
jgi:shikimate dehydrogenase